MKPIIVIGAGGHAHSILAILDRLDTYEPIGFIDSTKDIGSSVYGLPILGSFDDLATTREVDLVNRFVVGIGDNYARASFAQKLKETLLEPDLPSIVDPSAVIASDVSIGPGNVIMPLAHIGAGCILDEGVIVNTCSSLDHDSVVSSYASLAPGVVTGGGVNIGHCSAVCLGVNIVHKVSIGDHTIIGAGSLVLSDLPSRVVAYGTPASIIRSRLPGTPYL